MLCEYSGCSNDLRLYYQFISGGGARRRKRKRRRRRRKRRGRGM